MIGLDPIPYSHGIRIILNNKGSVVNELISRKIH